MESYKKEIDMRFEHVNCNICDSDRTKPIGERRSPGRDAELETNIVRCSSCGLIYPNPMPCAEKQEIQNNFRNPQEYFSGEITDRDVKRYERTIEIFEKLKPNKGNLLDIGCGRGELVYAATKRNWRATGTEISESFAQYAKEKFNVTVLVGDINDLGIPQESFDIVCLNSVIQYVDDPLRVLKKINSLLKKNGLLYIEVTNENALVFKMGDFFRSIREGERVTTHLSPLFPSFQIYGFNKKSLSFALKRAGFKIIDIKTRGITGGGEVKGHGPTNKMINFMRKVIILIGGLTGNGHLIYCLARKV